MAITVGVLLDPNILSEDELLNIYKSAVKLYAEGKTVMQWSGEGTESTKAFTAPIADILREARYALKQKNPAKYGYIATTSRTFFA